jgi:hypothetical protein
MKRIGYTKLVTGILAAGLVLGMVVVRPLVAAHSGLDEQIPDFHLVNPEQAQVDGLYAGQVNLEGVFTGVFSDPLAPQQEIDLGTIEIALALQQSDNEVTGYVALERTLIFTQEHTIAGKAVGPLVSGSFDGTTLELTSDKFDRVVSRGRTLKDGRILSESRATRQFQLRSTAVQADGARLEGIYRETIWGITPEPVTVEGVFDIQYFDLPKVTPLLEERIFVPLVMK